MERSEGGDHKDLGDRWDPYGNLKYSVSYGNN